MLLIQLFFNRSRVIGCGRLDAKKYKHTTVTVMYKLNVSIEKSTLKLLKW